MKDKSVDGKTLTLYDLKLKNLEKGMGIHDRKISLQYISSGA